MSDITQLCGQGAFRNVWGETCPRVFPRGEEVRRGVEDAPGRLRSCKQTFFFEQRAFTGKHAVALSTTLRTLACASALLRSGTSVD